VRWGKKVAIVDLVIGLSRKRGKRFGNGNGDIPHTKWHEEVNFQVRTNYYFRGCVDVDDVRTLHNPYCFKVCFNTSLSQQHIQLKKIERLQEGRSAV